MFSGLTSLHVNAARCGKAQRQKSYRNWKALVLIDHFSASQEARNNLIYPKYQKSQGKAVQNDHKRTLVSRYRITSRNALFQQKHGSKPSMFNDAKTKII